MKAMPENPGVVQVQPPQMIQSLAGGFNAVANNLHLILLPAVFDLLLWFGPHIRIKNLLENSIFNLIDLMRSLSPLEMGSFWLKMRASTALFFEQYNLLSQLSTFPVGIPSLLGLYSLLNGQAPVNTPWGAQPLMLELTSGGLTIVSLIGLSLLGLFIGTVYFSAVARSCTLYPGNTRGPETSFLRPASRLPAFRLSILTWQWFQVFVLVFLLILLSMLFILPAAWLSFFLFMVSPFLSRFVLLLAVFSVIWLLIPLCFSPHGIFLCGQSLFSAMQNSTKVVRFSETGTGWFLLASLILYLGLGILWRSAPDTSWVALVGIFGHAFVATGLLAASFIHYSGGLEYFHSRRKITLPGRAI